MVPPSPTVAEGAVLLRLPAEDRTWAETLPRVPGGVTVTVTLGHPDLVPADPTRLWAAGYQVVGVASEERPIGAVVDVLVPAELRASEPDWWQHMLSLARRAFDLRLGPVLSVLEAELAMHRRALEG
ncbi:MAG: hypothetical protein WD638_07295 [Nitriliruptoraceae bacterium]